MVSALEYSRLGFITEGPGLSWSELALQHLEKNDNGFERNESQITWPEKEKDFQVFQEIEQILEETANLDDEQFLSFIPQIQEILLRSVLMQKLNDPNIIVSKAHTGTTPFIHTINVLRKLVTTGYSREERKALRWGAIFHDPGKIFGANGRDSKYHPFLSALLVTEFVHKHIELPVELKQQLLYVIQYHHVFEELEMGRITKDELLRRFVDEKVASFFLSISNADMRSVAEYAPLIVKNIMLFLTIFPHLFTEVSKLLPDDNYLALFSAE